ncbi:Uncharacterized protein Rs2_51557 [Raphanus sativus]|nr:Uncharacterized protein Rs2_51557 [Raphanus sativus]
MCLTKEKKTKHASKHDETVSISPPTEALRLRSHRRESKHRNCREQYYYEISIFNTCAFFFYVPKLGEHQSTCEISTDKLRLAIEEEASINSKPSSIGEFYSSSDEISTSTLTFHYPREKPSLSTKRKDLRKSFSSEN